MMPFLIPLVTAQEVAFWFLAPITVLAAVGMVLSRRPVHSALSLAVVMICLAMSYASLDAPFLFVTQIIVYTGAILMLFLFVMMLVGVDTTDSMVETIRGQRIAAGVFVFGFAMLIIGAVGAGVNGSAVGLGEATSKLGGNVPSLAELIFTRYFYIFEGTAVLLITAAIAAMVLAHGERLRPRPSQRMQVADRMKAYATQGVTPGPRPGPGLFARDNSIDAPGLLPDGTPAPDSLSTALVERGAVVDADELKAPTEHAFKVISSITGGAEEEQG